MTKEERLERDLSHIERGPCGGWHWTGWNVKHHRHYCRACVALGSLPLTV
jgi:hypothetical protein